MDARQVLEAKLHREIPLSQAMGVKVSDLSSSRVEISAPLAPNINHKRTAFGGSLHSVAVLAGWSLMTATLQETGADVGYLVIQDSHMEYLKPVPSDFTATAAWPDEEMRKKFLNALGRKGVARAEVTAEIFCEGTLRARLRAQFVAEISKAD